MNRVALLLLGLGLLSCLPPDAAWTNVATNRGPPARQGGAMAYDSARAVTVLFGGLGSQGDLNDTWEWNGTAWSELHPVTSPPGRLGAMAYDSRRQVSVLFGGNIGSTVLNDTWEWDGTVWTQRLPATSPPGKTGHTMAYDSVGGVIVLFGGCLANPCGGPTGASDAWEWDGMTWSLLAGAGGPPPHVASGMAFDSARGATILFAGCNPVAANECLLVDDLWELSGTTWIAPHPASNPGQRGGPAMVFDSSRGTTVLFGGHGMDFLADTWDWNGTRWNQRSPPASPSARWNHSMAYDSGRNVTVLFGGADASAQFLDDTWEWTGK